MSADTCYPHTVEFTTPQPLPKDHNPSLKSAALAYARRGVPVFPLVAGGKRPLTKHGHLDATTDPRQVTEWWKRWPDANIGVPTGERSGLLVIDVDPRAGGGASLDELVSKHGPLPRTATVRTGGGGRHIYLRYPPGSNIRNTVGELGPGLDVRGEGGYVVAPPSYTTGAYEWLDKRPLADAPAWLLEALQRPESAAGKTLASPRPRPPIRDGESIPSGGRNSGLTRIAGRLRAWGFDGGELLAELERINLAQCSPPLPAGEVAKIARSAERWPVGNASSGPSPEAIAALESVEAGIWRRSWPGMAGKSERDILAALIKLARRHGESIPAGVRLTVDYRTLALTAATGIGTAHRAIQRLRHKDLVRYDNEGREDGEAGALVVVARKVEHSNHYAAPTTARAGGKSVPPCAPPAHHLRYRTLTAPRLRWSSREIRRLGKSCGQAVDTLEAAGGALTLPELAESMGVKRSRDLRRRVVDRLTEAGIVTVTGDTVALAGDWREALDLERERAGELEAYRRDVARYERAREAYARRHENRAEPVPEREEKEEAPETRSTTPATVEDPVEKLEPNTDNTLEKEKNAPGRPPDRGPCEPEEEGEPVDELDLLDLGIGQEEPAAPSPLAVAVRDYLERNPQARRQPPGWIGNTLWCEDLYPGKPTPSEVREALDELIGERAA